MSILNLLRKLQLIALVGYVGHASALDVAEVFSFTCIHCFNVEPQVEALAKQQKVNYIPVPLYDQDNINEVAVINAYFAAKDLGREWAFRQSYFGAVFSRGLPAYQPETLKYTLQLSGLNNAQFYKLASSAKVTKEVQSAVNLAIKYAATGTPTFIVNGARSYEGEDAIQQIYTDYR